MSSTDPQQPAPGAGTPWQTPSATPDPWRKPVGTPETPPGAPAPGPYAPGATPPNGAVVPYGGVDHGQAPAYGTAPGYGDAPAYLSAPGYGAAPGYGPQQPGPYAGYPVGYGAYGYPKNGYAVWALVLGILSIFTCGFLSGVPAIIVGGKARRAAYTGEADNPGLATAGVVLGWIGTGLSALALAFYLVYFVVIGIILVSNPSA